MSTSKLQRYVSQQLSFHFGQYTIRENTRPAWLTASEGERLELDFLIEELNIAIEVQGKQHYIYVPHFHGDYDGFLKRLEWDEIKRRKCDKAGIILIEVANKDEVPGIFTRISARIPTEEFVIDPPIFNVGLLREQYRKKLQKRLNKRLKCLHIIKENSDKEQVNNAKGRLKMIDRVIKKSMGDYTGSIDRFLDWLNS